VGARFSQAAGLTSVAVTRSPEVVQAAAMVVSLVAGGRVAFFGSPDAYVAWRARVRGPERPLDALVLAQEGGGGRAPLPAVDAGAGVEIEVADSGPGRPPSGLAGRRAAVERLGGTAACTNCPEGGTAVTLRLPHRRSRGMAA
jgi:signal transduction histidine kinase